MRIIIIIILVTGLAQISLAQSTVKIKLKDYETIKGKWLGMEQDQYLVEQNDGSILYIPAQMVYKLKLYKSYEEYPKYDNNRNSFYFGWSGDLNTTIGQENQNFKGVGLSGLIGYDWDHNYSLSISGGFRNMNIGLPETFLPVTLSVKKYLTHGRYLLFGGLEAGYQWGLKNKWQSPNTFGTREPWSSQIAWYQPRHNNGSGPSLTPLAGVRKIGKYGYDHVLSIGLHFQKFQSEQLNGDDPDSTIEIHYKRWRVSYGMLF